MKELKIGETGIINGLKVTCVTGNHSQGCTKCALRLPGRLEPCPVPCMRQEREDKTDVIYTLVEEVEKLFPLDELRYIRAGLDRGARNRDIMYIEMMINRLDTVIYELNKETKKEETK